MELSKKDKYYILFLYEQGRTYTSIVNEMKISMLTVMKWINKYKADENFKRKKGSGRPHITTAEDDNHIINIIKADKYSTTEIN